MGKRKEIKFLCRDGRTMEGAKEFCQQIMAGEIDLEARNRKYLEESEAKEKRRIEFATRQAAAFRDKLNAAGISYSTLLTLEAERESLGGMTQGILMEWERGEDSANG